MSCRCTQVLWTNEGGGKLALTRTHPPIRVPIDCSSDRTFREGHDTREYPELARIHTSSEHSIGVKARESIPIQPCFRTIMLSGSMPSHPILAATSTRSLMIFLTVCVSEHKFSWPGTPPSRQHRQHGGSMHCHAT